MIFASLGCHFNKCILKNISQYIVMLHLRWVGIYNDLHIVESVGLKILTICEHVAKSGLGL